MFAYAAAPASPIVDFLRDNFENIIFGIVGLVSSVIFAALFTVLRRRT